MNHYIKGCICIVIAVVLIFLFIALVSVGFFFSRDYNKDICIPLEEQVGEIVIREWSWGLGSGAEIYYRVGLIELELGRVTGGDDGYCPFEAGQYAVTVNGNEVTINWNFTSAANIGKHWDRTETFVIPEFKDWWKYL